jgi:uncharacterized protein YjdB
MNNHKFFKKMAAMTLAVIMLVLPAISGFASSAETMTSGTTTDSTTAASGTAADSEAAASGTSTDSSTTTSSGTAVPLATTTPAPAPAPTTTPGPTYIPSIKMAGHVQNVGWQSAVTAAAPNSAIVGVSGKNLRLEAVTFDLSDAPTGSGITVSAHVQNVGWQKSTTYVPVAGKTGSLLAGTEGKSLRMEAIQISLTGDIANDYDIYYRANVQGLGWLGWAKNGQKAGSASKSLRMEQLEVKLIAKTDTPPATDKEYFVQPALAYSAHVQNVGWMTSVNDGALAGTTGKSLRLEALKIQKPTIEGVDGNIYYSVDVIGKGWTQEVSNGAVGGTSGESKAISAIKIRLDGKLAELYDVYYQLHTANIGWMNWAKNGEASGTSGLSKRAEAIKIVLVKKGGKAPSGSDSSLTYVEGYADKYFRYKTVGTESGKSIDSDWKTAGTTAGKENNNNFTVNNFTVEYTPASTSKMTGSVSYNAYVQGTGWLTNAVGSGKAAGTTDGSKRIEAIKISLSGEVAKYYNVWYRVYVQDLGWKGWAKNGQAAGSTKIDKKIEAIQVKLLSKDQSDPGPNSNYYTETLATTDMEKRAQSYTSSSGYLIMLDRTLHKVGIFTGSKGNWKLVKSFACSIGKSSTQTPRGVYHTTGAKGRYFNTGSVGRCWYYTQIKGNYLFHSVIYRRDGNSPETSTIIDGTLGASVSHGCVRLDVKNAKWIYDNIPKGTTIVIYN